MNALSGVDGGLYEFARGLILDLNDNLAHVIHEVDKGGGK